METVVKEKIKRKKKTLIPKIEKIHLKKRKNPIELFGILKGKIFYESDEVLIS